MADIEYLSIFVKGITFGATLLMAATMLTAIYVGKRTNWQKALLGITSITMFTHAVTLLYRVIIDLTGYSNYEHFSTGAFLLDTLCIAPLAVLEVMLTRHTTLSFKSIALIYCPFVAFIILHFATENPMVCRIAFGFTLVASLGWAVMTYRDMRRYNEHLRQTYSDFEGRDLTWLVRILLLLVFALCIWAASTMIGTYIAKILYRLTIICVWFALCRRVVIQKEAKEMEDLTPDNGSVFRMQRSCDGPIDPNVFLVGKELEDMMREKQMFKQYDLNTIQLAQTLNCSKSLIGQYFASKGTTFHTYVNDMRLEYAVEQLLRTNEPIMTVAQSSGFSFDSAFAAAFQHKFGCSPREYRERYKTNNK